jgi:hypothetical protein
MKVKQQLTGIAAISIASILTLQQYKNQPENQHRETIIQTSTSQIVLNQRAITEYIISPGTKNGKTVLYLQMEEMNNLEQTSWHIESNGRSAIVQEPKAYT